MSFKLCGVWPHIQNEFEWCANRRGSLSQVKAPCWDPHYVCVCKWGTIYTKPTKEMADRKCQARTGLKSGRFSNCHLNEC